jgi:DNA-3-methyladenine glycosylase
MAAQQASPVPAEGAALTAIHPATLRPLGRRFYARPPLVVARGLLGRWLVRRLDDSVLIGRIVECEAYQQDDAASHSFRGPTSRTDVMFGPPGRLYVYFTYGMHFCMNVVTGRDGEGSAVLLRAVEPLHGLEKMVELRGVSRVLDLCRGPGRLTEALGISRSQNGADLVDGSEIFVASGRSIPGDRVGVSRRVGIRVATEQPWRLYERDSPFVSGRR